MLTQVAEGVLIHESEFCQSNAVVVQGGAGVLLIDAGVHEDEMSCLESDLSELGHTVVAGFSTHPHWDHLLVPARVRTPARPTPVSSAAGQLSRAASGGQAAVSRAQVSVPMAAPSRRRSGSSRCGQPALQLPLR